MRKPTNEKEALLELASQCSRAEHCTYEMTEKMRRWGIDEDAQERVIERLKKDKYIDESRYAAMYARDKARFNKWGRRKIEQGLWMKRIPKDIANEALGTISDDEYVSVLRPMLKQKRRSVKADSDYELKTKLIKFALQRGFTMDIISRCIDGADEIEEE